jgi:hypothetical protein
MTHLYFGKGKREKMELKKKNPLGPNQSFAPHTHHTTM